MENTFHIQWHITDFCNLRCRHCYQSTFAPDTEIPFSKLENIFDNIVSFAQDEGKELVIDITGGEPFLCKRWEDLVSLINGCPTVKETGMITNGMFIDKNIISRLERLSHFTLKVSAEGFTEQIYEYFRGRGTYGSFLKACNLLQTATFEKVLMMTVFTGSVTCLEEMFAFMETYAFDATILERFIPWGRGLAERQKVVSLAEWKEILHRICKKCGLGADEIEQLVPYRAFMVKNDSGRFNLFGAPCIVATDGMALMPDGTVFPCRRFPLAIGNLQETALKDIWEKSSVLAHLRGRNFLKGRCKKCIISRCLGCRALAYSLTGDFLSEDPLCIKE